MTITAQPPSPSKIEPVAEHQNVELLQRKVASLQEALDQAESQTQLINMEYRKLLADKEVSVNRDYCTDCDSRK